MSTGTPIPVLSPADIKLLQGIRDDADSWKQSDAERLLLDRLIASGSPANAHAEEQPGVVSLTALSEARAKMTVGEYVLAEHDEAGDDGALHIVALRRHEGGEVAASVLVALMPDDMRADDDAAGIVAMHSAVPVLIEVVRTALNLRYAQLAATYARTAARGEGNATGLANAASAEQLAASSYDVALTKVSL